MWQLLPLLMIPVLVAIGFRAAFGKTLPAKSLVQLEILMLFLVGLGLSITHFYSLRDVEFWNGRVTDKMAGSQKCCHCHTVCDMYQTTENSAGNAVGKRCLVSHEECQHFRDYWWKLSFSTGDTLSIASCEPNPHPPAVWESAYVGEPAAIPHSYTNYLLADPDSLLIQHALDVKVPKYPHSYGVYKVKRAIPGNTRMPVAAWNEALDELNAELGARKQVNIIVVATTTPSPTYAEAVERSWLYGKKNDVVFVLGAPDGDIVQWARVVTISRVEMLKTYSRDELVGLSLLDLATVAKIGSLVETHFTRTPMANFEYLSSMARPSTGVVVSLYVAGLVLSFVGALLMTRERKVPLSRRPFHYIP